MIALFYLAYPQDPHVISIPNHKLLLETPTSNVLSACDMHNEDFDVKQVCILIAA